MTDTTKKRSNVKKETKPKATGYEERTTANGTIIRTYIKK